MCFTGFPRDQSLNVSIKQCGQHSDIVFLGFFDLEEVCVSVGGTHFSCPNMVAAAAAALANYSVLPFLFIPHKMETKKASLSVPFFDKVHEKKSCYIIQIKGS